MENGKFYFRKNASWLNDLESELLLFPRAAHDDIVDNVSMAADEVVTPAIPLAGDPVPVEATSNSIQFLPVPVQEIDPFAWASQHGWGDD